SPEERAAQLAAELGDADLVGQVLMPSVNLDDSAADSAELGSRYRLGAVILMGDVENTAAGGSAAQVRALTDEMQTAARALPAKIPLLVGTDQEYGWVTRIKSGMV